MVRAARRRARRRPHARAGMGSFAALVRQPPRRRFSTSDARRSDGDLRARRI